MKTSRWIAACLAVSAMGAQAQGLQMPKPGPWTLAFAFVPLTIAAPGGSIDAQVGRVMASYQLTPMFEVEGMAAGSLQEVSVSGTTGRLTQALGLFVKPGWDLGPGLRGFVRLGSVHFRLEGRDSTGTVDGGSRTTTAYGAGFSYRLNDRWLLGLDYMHYATVSGTTGRGPALGLAYGF